MQETNGSYTQTHFQSGQKGEYYPTDIRIAPYIARAIYIKEPYRPSYIRNPTPELPPSLLDPSCGEGIFVNELGKLIGATTYGNEINPLRYAKAHKLLDHCTKGAAETLMAHSKFSIGFVNPPYNIGAKYRMEYEHVKHMAENFVDDLLIAVLPRSILTDRVFWIMWLRYFKNANHVYRMIGEDYERWGQHVLFGEPNYYPYTPNSTQIRQIDEEIIPKMRKEFSYPCIDTIQSHLFEVTPARYENMQLRNRVPNFYEVSEAIDAKYPEPFKTSRYLQLMAPTADILHTRAAMPTRKSIAVQRAVAGSASGIEVELWPGRKFLISGSWRKFETTVTKENEDGSEITKCAKQNIAYTMRCISLSDGYSFSIDSANDQEAYQDFIENHLDKLIDAVDAAHPPLYNMDYSPWLREFALALPPRLLKRRKDSIFAMDAAQMHIAAAQLTLMSHPEGSKNGILPGEMGVGKTFVSAVVMAIRAGFYEGKPGKVIVVSPPQPIPKWIEEMQNIFSNVKGFKAFYIGEERKCAHVESWTSTLAEALRIQTYRALEAKIELGTATKAERNKLSELKQFCVVGNSYMSKRDRATIESNKPLDGERKRYLVEGTTCTYRSTRSCKLTDGEDNKHRGTAPWFIIPEYTLRHIKRSKPVLDTIEAMEYNGPSVLVMSYQTAKMGAPWHHSVITRRQVVNYKNVTERTEGYGRNKRKVKYSTNVTKELPVHHCPHCGQPLLHSETREPWSMGAGRGYTLMTKGQGRVAYRCPNTIAKGHLLSSGSNTAGGEWGSLTRTNSDEQEEWEEVKCNSPLFEFESFSYGGRWPVAAFLNERYGGKFYLIMDEAHHTKGGNTQVGMASHKLICGALNALAMTGTLSNGFADSLFYLMYRMDKRFRSQWEYKDVSKFVEMHGMSETVTHIKQEKSGGSSHYGAYNTESSSYTKPIPGTSPALVAMITPIATFLRMHDLGFELPPKIEKAVPVIMDESMAEGYGHIKAYRPDAIQAYRLGNKGLLARVNNAELAWPDYGQAEVLKGLGPIPEAPMPEEGYAKDRQLVALVWQETIQDNRGCVISVEQAIKRDPRHRIHGLLDRKGIHSTVMERDVKPDQRIGFIRDVINKSRKLGQEPVLICNGDLIKEGIDMTDFKNWVEVGQHYNITSLEQRLARIWRLGQTDEVHYYFMLYLHTIQERALAWIAHKLRAAQQLHGEVAAGISKYGAEDAHDFIQDMMLKAEDTKGPKLSELMQIASFDDVEFERPTKKPKQKIVTATTSELNQVLAFAREFTKVDTKVEGVQQFSFL